MFDRETPASVEASGVDIREGLYSLWLHTLREGILDDGSASFSRFHLAWGEPESKYVDAGVEPFDNHTLVKLRRWAGFASIEQYKNDTRGTNQIVRRLAELHYELLQKSELWAADTLYWSEEAREVLARVNGLSDPGELLIS